MKRKCEMCHNLLHPQPPLDPMPVTSTRSTDIISYYDRVMTVSRATEMQGHVSHGIRNILSSMNPARVFISLGFPYGLAISHELIDFLDTRFDLRIASGPIGKRLHQLKEWLESLRLEAMT